MSKSNHLHLTLNEFAKKKNINLNISEGASILTTSEDKEIWLEYPKDGELFIIHMAVLDNISELRNSTSYENLLKINANIEKNRGAWFAIHETTRSLRLCVALPVDTINFSVIDTSIQHIIHLAKDVM
ncbi:MAG: CesT family type III secretion system chaperone [Pseudomonadota bacterium]